MDSGIVFFFVFFFSFFFSVPDLGCGGRGSLEVNQFINFLGARAAFFHGSLGMNDGVFARFFSREQRKIARTIKGLC